MWQINTEKFLDRAQRWVFIPVIFFCLIVLLFWTIDPVRGWLVQHGVLKDVDGVVGMALVVTIFILVSFDQRLARTEARLASFSPAASSRIFQGGVSTIYSVLNETLQGLGPEAATGDKTLDVLGLTLFTVWPIALQPRLVDGSLRDWKVNVYCLSPDFVEANSYFSRDWVMQSQAQLTTIQAFAQEKTSIMNGFGTKLSVSKYSFFPAVHGFKTGAGHLFISFIHWLPSAERLETPLQFYEVFLPSDKSMRASVYRALFDNWIARAQRDAAAGRIV